MGVQDLFNNPDKTTIEELYEFKAFNKVFYFTSADKDIVYNGITYSKIEGLKRSNLKKTFNPSNSDLTISFPMDNDFAREALNQNPEENFTVQLTQRLSDDNEVVFYERYSSSIIGVSFDSSNKTINLKSSSNLFSSSPFNGNFILKNCRHNLYNEGCRVTKESFSVTGRLISPASGTTITHPIFSTKEDGWFKAGYILINDFIFREIIEHIGDTIELDNEISDSLNAGLNAEFFAFAGCDHTIATCKNKFSNSDNYGGFPYLPLKDPTKGV